MGHRLRALVLEPAYFDAVFFGKIVDAKRAALDVEDHQASISCALQTALRNVIGKTILVDMLDGRERISSEARKIARFSTKSPRNLAKIHTRTDTFTATNHMGGRFSRATICFGNSVFWKGHPVFRYDHQCVIERFWRYAKQHNRVPNVNQQFSAQDV